MGFNMTIQTTCQHVLFMNANGAIRCALCDAETKPTKIKYPKLAWLWANWWIIKQKVKYALGI